MSSKNLFASSLFIILFLALPATYAKEHKKTKAEYSTANCFTICNKTLKKKCPKKFKHYQLETCLKDCHQWSDSQLECIDTANKCEQLIISNNNVVCRIDDIEDPYIHPTYNLDCNTACKKYAKCASYTKGVTKRDIEDAYYTCNDACQDWPQRVIKCISRCKITSPASCICPTRCVIGNAQDMIPPGYKMPHR